ncbi:hypothetical protein [Streptomyces violaceusniger]|uniref:Uncharacterized protein n=1 Tax=Streptomyces violaceusniger (strain Tu 4113) TaxID=653045 RepID=G2PHS5_STRV4|nr:hypothetical protein [Streptomyces violaceusniger]AEM88876.1 hypothetical protein Strvi_0100 [Streptomyces violaceusniger Tu 4113]
MPLTIPFPRPRRWRRDPETERIVRGLHRRIRAGEYRPGTPLPSLDCIEATCRPVWSTSATSAIEVLVKQGVARFPLEGGGRYWVAFTPTRRSLMLERAVPVDEPALWHLYRPERSPFGVLEPPEARSLCGISMSLYDGSMRTLDPARATCAACCRRYADGAIQTEPHTPAARVS